MTCAIDDNGVLTFSDSAGNPMPEHLVEAAKKQNKEAILGLIQRKCDEINEQVEALGRLHHDTPTPQEKPQFVAPAFEDERPALPQPRALGLLDKLLAGRRRKKQEADARDEAAYREKLREWEQRKAEFDKLVAKRRHFIEELIYTEVPSMEAHLEETLQEIVWPRETLVAVDIQDGGARVLLDVDLPELEDMPNKTAAVPSRGLRLSVKELAASKVQKLYSDHVHGIIFRIIGEVFAALPTARSVTASGYSQRRDPATAQTRDDYLLSVAVSRDAWEQIDFRNVAAVDATEALARFDLRREQLKSGALRTITPH
jgi:hypothetical protein